MSRQVLQEGGSSAQLPLLLLGRTGGFGTAASAGAFPVIRGGDERKEGVRGDFAAHRRIWVRNNYDGAIQERRQLVVHRAHGHDQRVDGLEPPDASLAARMGRMRSQSAT
ncbi:hypothetical protein PF010_g32683 [Phytophthora fragariae]|uniref:Uncharacterized protein n=1 Tax=Phytophthora fragariae TaxID=53985 RepID=A0A6A3G782_9STRA|nr:hypothetical protein PF011_g32473 [Phytophthora fragariae]KAE9054079.1 hypothetical protein PF010_g32683 [Phytophthora fragariae]KAE9259932.1 hypothetical protein PF001_g32881 [Phytophthora fragariae]KAE9308435.1 hypothetical protein PF008_g20967 [Phytophthora fragariae]